MLKNENEFVYTCTSVRCFNFFSKCYIHISCHFCTEKNVDKSYAFLSLTDLKQSRHANA